MRQPRQPGESGISKIQHSIKDALLRTEAEPSPAFPAWGPGFWLWPRCDLESRLLGYKCTSFPGSKNTPDRCDPCSSLTADAIDRAWYLLVNNNLSHFSRTTTKKALHLPLWPQGRNRNELHTEFARILSGTRHKRASGSPLSALAEYQVPVPHNRASFPQPQLVKEMVQYNRTMISSLWFALSPVQRPAADRQCSIIS